MILFVPNWDARFKIILFVPDSGEIRILPPKWHCLSQLQGESGLSLHIDTLSWIQAKSGLSLHNDTVCPRFRPNWDLLIKLILFILDTLGELHSLPWKNNSSITTLGQILLQWKHCSQSPLVACLTSLGYLFLCFIGQSVRQKTIEAMLTGLAQINWYNYL